MGILEQSRRRRDNLLRGQFCPVVIRFDHMPTQTCTWVYGFDPNRAFTMSAMHQVLAKDVETLETEILNWIISEVRADGLDVGKMVSPSPPSYDDALLVG